MKILMAVALTFPTIGAAAETPPPTEGPAPIYLAIDKIKNRIHEHGGIGHTFMEAGHIMFDVGLIGIAAGFLLSMGKGTRWIPIANFGKSMMKITGPMITVGIVGELVGYVVAQLGKANKNHPTSADPYKSPEGMEKFLNLTPEEQAAIVAEDEAFTKFIQDSASGLESLEPESGPK